MVRKEITGQRSLDFSRWIRKNLPDSATGFMVSNQDWVFWNFKTRRLIFAEEKTRQGELAPWFRRLIRDVFHPALREFCPKHGIDYRGYHLIQFENTCVDNGKA